MAGIGTVSWYPHWFKDSIAIPWNVLNYKSRTEQKLCILGATSGDTGAAAISGLLGKTGVEVFIFYPNEKFPLQERQMTCTGASNVYPIAIEGTFDDAQRTVKSFWNTEFSKTVGLSAI